MEPESIVLCVFLVFLWIFLCLQRLIIGSEFPFAHLQWIFHKACGSSGGTSVFKSTEFVLLCIFNPYINNEVRLGWHELYTEELWENVEKWWSGWSSCQYKNTEVLVFETSKLTFILVKHSNSTQTATVGKDTVMWMYQAGVKGHVHWGFMSQFDEKSNCRLKAEIWIFVGNVLSYVLVSISTNNNQSHINNLFPAEKKQSDPDSQWDVRTASSKLGQMSPEETFWFTKHEQTIKRSTNWAARAKHIPACCCCLYTFKLAIIHSRSSTVALTTPRSKLNIMTVFWEFVVCVVEYLYVLLLSNLSVIKTINPPLEDQEIMYVQQVHH